MKKARGSGHYFGVFLLVVVALAVFFVSVTLSLIFFRSITPPGNDWFTYFGLSLTEGGFLCWLGAFLWVRHHAFHTFVEFTMTCLSLGGILATAGVELYSLMPYTSIDVHTSFIANVVGIMLEVVFIANVISVFLAAIVFYSEANPGWFRGGGGENYIAQSYPQQNYIQEQRGEPARPLASRRQSQTQPKVEPATFDQEAETPEIEEPKPRVKPLPKPKKNPQQVSQNLENNLVKEGASTVTQGLKSFIGNTWPARHVRGKTNQTTEENG